MKTKLHMARKEDLPRLTPMVEAFHAEHGIVQDDETRAAALLPLLEGSPLGVIYIVGPRNAPVGYVAISFGWSIEMGGIDGFIDEIWIRPAVRDKGMGSEALSALIPALREAGVAALHLEVDENSSAVSLYERLGFASRERYFLMTADLRRKGQ
ncbi:GNAT family N-acetyltransferase [Tropicimonas isoalkanivorans]|uniref:Ribosomal protein S18 acetylase RimI n=1 Tax=Tropicimonas isoalkanivorans TaxID=441112 RepID=A0A1I1DWQ6_9RHOB|nr:GNAT family N-acetyltransferase [Tropicimonas isoalkanivorans]SFB79234.1 Ribosomal protein S18 acetylase RimI [Tropicimonas isoalkanivorans]